MPTHQHEAILRLIRQDPGIIPELLRDALRVPVPPFTALDVAENAVTEAMPPELRADAVILLKDAGGAVVGAVVVEVQRARDDDKPWTWPVYQATVRARHRCPVMLLVVAVTAGVARWAERAVELAPGRTWAPHVIGPDRIPRIVDAATMREHPTLGALSALTHAEAEEDLEVLEAAFEGLPLSSLTPDEVRYYLQVIELVAGPALAGALEKTMSQYEIESPGPIFRKMREEWAKGRNEGRAEGERHVLRRLLLARFGELSESARERIEAAGVDELETWTERLLSASTVADVFGDA